MGATLRLHAELSQTWLCVAPYSLPSLGLLFRQTHGERMARELMPNAFVDKVSRLCDDGKIASWMRRPSYQMVMAMAS